MTLVGPSGYVQIGTLLAVSAGSGTVLWQGWLLTLQLSAASLVGGLLLGIILANGKRSRIWPWRVVCNAYVELVKNLPLLAQVLILYFVFTKSAGIQNVLPIGVLTLSSFSAAYIAEIVAAGVGSVATAQLDSARAMGASKLQIFRKLVLPQAFRHMLPGLGAQFVSIVKDSSLLSVVGIGEFTRAIQDSRSEFWLLAFGYLVLTFPISMWVRAVEKKRSCSVPHR